MGAWVRAPVPLVLCAACCAQVASPRLGAKLLHDVALLGLDTEDKQQVFVWLLGSLRPLLPQAKAEASTTAAGSQGHSCDSHAGTLLSQHVPHPRLHAHTGWCC